jgi:putative toxin-antitoxin system antitoxin component (TIGR02293 family)
MAVVEEMSVHALTVDVGHSQKPRLKSHSITTLVEFRPQSVRFSAVAELSGKLGIDPAVLLEVIDIPERTAARRRQEGVLKAAEADRLSRVARVLQEAIRVFGSQEKAARWLKAASPALYRVAPLSLLETDAGTQAVTDELGRIDFGDFA